MRATAAAGGGSVQARRAGSTKKGRTSPSAISGSSFAAVAITFSVAPFRTTVTLIALSAPTTITRKSAAPVRVPSAGASLATSP